MTASDTLSVPSDQTQTQDTRQSNNGRSAAEPYLNIGATERLVSALAGGAMVLNGLRLRSTPGAILALIGGAMVHRGYTGHCHGYAAVGINRAEGPGAAPEEYFQRGIHVTESVTINKSAEELYAFWHNFENLPRIMSHLRSVKVIDERRSHWEAKAPAGLSVGWDAEIINDQKNVIIAWRSLHPASVDNAGSVRFAAGPSGRGTEISVTLDYIPPAGRLGWAVAKLFGDDPASQIREDLRRLKQLMEAGETPTIEGQPHGRRGMLSKITSPNS